MINNSNLGIIGVVASVAAIGYTGFVHYKLNKINDIINISIDNISKDIKVDISETVINSAIDKAVICR